MTQINSPFLLKKLRPREQFTREVNNYLDQLERILEQTYRRLGGPVDDTQDMFVFASDRYPNPDESSEGMFLAQAYKEDRLIDNVKTSNYTISDGEWIEARNGISITFPLYPGDDTEFVTAKGDNTKITFDGNGKKIFWKGRTYDKVVSRSSGDSYTWRYFSNQDYYRAI